MAVQLPLPFVFHFDHGFEDYHAGPNGETLAHLQACAAGQGESPIFLWAPEGRGKTHLLQACCREAHRLGRAVSYLPLKAVETYGAEILEGLERQQLVCLDDIQAVCGREDWELGLFTLFNGLRDRGHALIASSPAPPADLSLGLPDLKTRLGWGLTLMLRPLDEADTLAALSLQARRLGLELEPPVGRFLLVHHRRDLSSLRRLLEDLDRATLSAKRKLTIPFLKTYLEQSSS